MRRITCYITLVCAIFVLHACKSSQPQVENTETPTDPRKAAFNRIQIEQLYVEACTQMMRGDYTTSLEQFEEVLSKDPENHAAMFNIAKILMEQRKYDEAIRYSKSAIGLESGNYWYYHLLQQTYEMKGDYANAVTLQEEIVDRFPRKFQDRLKLVELYLRNNQLEKAMTQLESIEEQAGPNPETLLRKYQILSQSRKYEEALAVTDELIRINPAETRYHQLKIETLQKMNRAEEAIAAMEELLDQDPGNAFALLSLAEYYKSVDELDKSDKYLYQAFRNPSIDPEFKMNLISGLLQYVAAEPEILPRIKTLAKLFNETHPGSAKAYAIEGKLMSLENKVDSANVLYRKSLELEPSNTDVWLDLLETSLDEPHFERLYKDSGDALEYFPNQERFLFFYGISGSYLGKLRPAANALEKIKRMGIEDRDMMTQVYSELGKIYHQQEKYEDSDYNYEEALKLTPNDPYILNNYAYYLALRNDKLDRAKEMIEKALERNPDQTSYQDTYGWILFQQGAYGDAANWLGKAAQNSSSPVILEHYGDALFKLGKKDEAISQWKKAIENGAENLNIQLKQQEQ